MHSKGADPTSLECHLCTKKFDSSLFWSIETIFRQISDFKTCYLLALTSDRRVSELNGLSYKVKHLRGWTFLLSPLCLESSLTRYLLWLVHYPFSQVLYRWRQRRDVSLPIQNHQAVSFKMDQHHLACSDYFVLSPLGERKRVLSWIAYHLFFLFRSVINEAYKSASDSGHTAGKAETRKVRNTDALVQFKINFTVQLIMRIGMWASQTKFTSCYFRDVTKQAMNIFPIGLMVTVSKLCNPGHVAIILIVIFTPFSMAYCLIGSICCY